MIKIGTLNKKERFVSWQEMDERTDFVINKMAYLSRHLDISHFENFSTVSFSLSKDENFVVIIDKYTEVKLRNVIINRSFKEYFFKNK